jgi:tRNA-specific 2-thiouridylase
MYYTIGQRKGLNIGGNTDKMFVVGKNLDKNILYVSFGEDNDYLLSDSCIVENVNFISDLRPNTCTCKFRYRQADIEVNIEYLDNGELLVRYDNVKAVTPGQACVLYLGDECLGGGIIKEVRKNNQKLWYLL